MPTLAYFEQLLPHLSPAGVLVFDDVEWSAGMADAWSRIRSDHRVGLAVDLFKVGICGLGGAERAEVDLSDRARLISVVADHGSHHGRCGTVAARGPAWIDGPRRAPPGDRA